MIDPFASSDEIDSLSREKIEDRRDVTLPLWENHNQPPPVLPFRSPDTPPIFPPTPVLAVAFGSWRPAWLPDFLRKMAQAGTRIYVLVEAWQGQQEQLLLKELAARMLVRIGAQMPAPCLLSDKGASGLLYLGGPSETPRHEVSLLAPQSRILFEIFVDLFWHQALKEFVGGTLAPCRESPAFDEAGGGATQRGASHLLREPPRVFLPQPEILVTPLGNLGKESSSALQIVTPPVRTPNALELARGGAQLSWVDLGLPSLQIAGRSGAVLLQGGGNHLVFPLPERDSLRLRDTIQDCLNGCWRFYPERRLGDVQGEVFRPGQTAPEEVQDEQIITLSDVTARDPLSLSDTVPESWPQPSPLFHRVRYRWRVLPPRAPAGATVDPLVNQWKDLDQHVERRINLAKGCLQEAKARDRGVLSRLGSLLPFWNKRIAPNFQQIEDQLDQIAERPLSARGTEACSLLSLLTKIEQRLREELKASDDLEQKEEEKRAQTEQQAAYEEQQKKVQAECLAAQAARAAAEHVEKARREERQALMDELEALQKEFQQKEHQERCAKAAARALEVQASLLKLEEEARALELRSASTMDKKQQKSHRREQQKLGEEIKRKKREQEQAEVEAIRPFVLAPRQFPEELSEDQEEVAELSRQLEKLRQEIQEHQQKEQAAQKLLGQPFVFQPPPKVHPRKTPTPSKEVKIPEDTLPSVGELLTYRGIRYLVVSTIEEARFARPEAQRLQARLVAPA